MALDLSGFPQLEAALGDTLAAKQKADADAATAAAKATAAAQATADANQAAVQASTSTGMLAQKRAALEALEDSIFQVGTAPAAPTPPTS